MVHAADESKVVVQGLDGYIVAEKHGQLLVCSLKEEQRIKEFGTEDEPAWVVVETATDIVVAAFGSRARGTNHPKSDIDLAIYGCEDFGDLSDCLNEELWSLLKLDIINMDDKHISPVLVTEIERDGK